jgi:hypothetical protein
MQLKKQISAINDGWRPLRSVKCFDGWIVAATAVLLGPAACALPAAGSAALDAGQAKEPRYLLFWRTPEQVPALVAAVGTRGDGRHLLGFGIPCATLELEKQVPVLVHQAFATARKCDVALMLHFDFHLAWKSRPDLWNWFDPNKPGYNPANRDNVEWFGWDGPPARVRYLNHGILQRMPPPICFTSKRIRAEWTRLVNNVISPALRQEVAALQREGQSRLFAGVLVGSEPMFDDYSDPDAEMAKMIAEDGTPRGRLGFRALRDCGFSKEHPPADLTDALNDIVQETVAFWCRLLVDAGLPAAKLYPHIAPQVPIEMDGAGASAAFNRWSRPGWTTYPVMQLEQGFGPLYAELSQHGNPPWGGVEANAGFPDSTVDWETYLGWHYNHAAVLVAINMGATGTDLPSLLEKSAFSSQAVAAYRKFLHGMALKELPVAGRPEMRFQLRMHSLQATFRSWQAVGRDPSHIARDVETRLRPLLQSRRYDEAVKVIDEALVRLKAK